MKFLLKLIAGAEGIFRNLKNNLLRSANPQYREVERWYAEDPHNLKRSDFGYLNSESIVFDLGGYTGEWTSEIAARYCSSVYVFEPVNFYVKLMRHRFAGNPKIKIFDFGLADKTQEVTIHVDKFASSIFNKNDGTKPTEKIKLVAFGTFVQEHQVAKIDLVKINIEGAEYDLLYEIIRAGYISSIKGLLVQFHDFVPGAHQKRAELQNQLSQTHQKVFDYSFVWEYWQRKVN
jgi:FkbM family methyltransferase